MASRSAKPAKGVKPLRDLASNKVVQLWVHPTQLPRVLGRIYEHMQMPVDGTGLPAAPHLSEYTVADDRGGSGHYWIRFDEAEIKLAEARSIFGKGLDVTLEDR